MRNLQTVHLRHHTEGSQAGLGVVFRTNPDDQGGQGGDPFHNPRWSSCQKDAHALLTEAQAAKDTLDYVAVVRTMRGYFDLS
jgi:hypothetical protein